MATVAARSRAARPTLDVVIEAIAPGRIIRLRLTAEQRCALGDRDGRIALAVLRALIAARRRGAEPSTAPPEFPLVAHVIQAVGRRLGHGHVGIKRCHEIRRRLVAAQVIEDAGSYRQAY